MDDFLSDQWESVSVRHAFIRKVSVLFINAFIADTRVHHQYSSLSVFEQVYFILAAQLSFTVAIVAVFTFV